MKPKRIQRKRSKGWRMPDNTVYVGRPGTWGNPFIVGKHINEESAYICDLKILKESIIVKDRQHAVELYRIWLTGDFKDESLKKAGTLHFELIGKPKLLKALKGKDLACWCSLEKPCHADVLLKIANNGNE